jgi:cobalt transporter subunit CbtB
LSDTNRHQILDSHDATLSRERLAALPAAAAAALLGVFILYGVGFAHSDVLHEAAHDTRHIAAFPCH